MKSLLLAGLILLTAAACPAQTHEATIAVDSGLIVLRVYNHYELPITVYLYVDEEPRRRRVAVVPPNVEGFLPLTSAALGTVHSFIVFVESADSTLHAFRTGLIWRNPAKIMQVVLHVAPNVPADSMRARGWIPGRPQS